ncbi:hypothetical protein [Corallococcus sp. AB049A]|uniref:hypothetical protein n=1 Tax=Corallococcus sp. AB049A TaxID=2316721 RepID=UPI0013156021|nr:hypothetical protein [Corallococcus sp. AB049A]
METGAPAPELARQEKALCGSCGDFICDPATENPSSCPQDCPDLSDFCYVTPAD